MDFIRDFFFTDIPNHVEFLKWTQTLDKGDDVLLIGILERIVSTEPPIPILPFYGSTDATAESAAESAAKSAAYVRLCDRDDDDGNADANANANANALAVVRAPARTKNPFHIAKGYARMQDLDDHDYNIYEYAYLSMDTSWKTRAAAYVAASIQVLFLGVLVVYNIFEQQVYISPDEDFFDEVVMVMLISTALFATTVRSQFLSCESFVAAMTEFGRKSKQKGKPGQAPRRKGKALRGKFLVLDVIINKVMGVFIFFFNIYFILVSDTPTDAVLNSVALAFILEIDDYFTPNWNDDRLEDAIAYVLEDYITEPFDSASLMVTRDGMSLLSCSDDGNKFYVNVPESMDAHGGFSVTIYFASEKDVEANVTTKYDTTVYNVFGTKAGELHSALREFHCLDNMKDFQD